MTEDGDASGTVSMCTLRIDAGWYGVETGSVHEVLRGVQAQRVPLAPREIAGLIAHRGEVLTIVSLRVLLGMEEAFCGGSILVMHDAGTEEQFGLAVDAVEGVVTLRRGAAEPIPPTLNMRCSRLFEGLYQTQHGVMAKLKTQRLAPGRFEEEDLGRKGEPC